MNIICSSCCFICPNVSFHYVFYELIVILLQVPQVFDKEILEEAQCERLASGNCFQQRAECLRTAVFQHC